MKRTTIKDLPPAHEIDAGLRELIGVLEARYPSIHRHNIVQRIAEQIDTLRVDGRVVRAVPIREFVHDILIIGPVLQHDVISQGEAKGFSLYQLRRARDAIGAVAFKRRGGNLASPWLWAMPEHAPPSRKSVNG